ncbi:MAG: peptide deformylase [Candidatus Buchananbacteria bacterium RIFCSPHIGHO2_01_FULL_39_14]|uniref:Peptide deformylase n=1 Tax=Candidatus Buchananbacteria bacterium RIFCSPHIGHO2_01_FULL_39_14 TaxID=1797532 RepID=A0A1G1XWQ8_9BACT|nr:MAG: peptide deformylase [Candidatus Buchananbacteria bacterium RIFCSPHIGHO2_01_FULL_39_14]OGY48210.1 MAG: peptide deformylase [Candidatus Buchananbacteria bacterium RIFCSPHIGHO2_02_FULL_39_17]
MIKTLPLPLEIYPSQILREKARELKQKELQNQEIKQLILNMAKTMRENAGVGLAAPQIGVSKRIALIEILSDNPRYPNQREVSLVVLINPKITRRSFHKELGEEGCLSIPEVFGLVKRSLKIKVKALDQEGKKIKFKATGFFARVIQHEVDHLNGVLFIDKTKEITKGKEILESMTNNF